MSEEQSIKDAHKSLRNAELLLKQAKEHVINDTNVFIRKVYKKDKKTGVEENDKAVERFTSRALQAIPGPIPKKISLWNDKNGSAGKLSVYLREKVLSTAYKRDTKTRKWVDLGASKGIQIQRIMLADDTQPDTEEDPAADKKKKKNEQFAENKPFMYRYKFQTKVPAELFLMTVARCSAMGECEPDLLFARDHPIFVKQLDGRTNVRHTVSSTGSLFQGWTKKRDFSDLSTWGTCAKDPTQLVYAASSAPTLFPENVIDSWYEMKSVRRGDHQLQGLVLKPAEVKDSALFGLIDKGMVNGCEVTFLSQVDWKGHVPKMFVEAKATSRAVAMLRAAEALALKWQADGSAAKILEQHFQPFCKAVTQE